MLSSFIPLTVPNKLRLGPNCIQQIFVIFIPLNLPPAEILCFGSAVKVFYHHVLPKTMLSQTNPLCASWMCCFKCQQGLWHATASKFVCIAQGTFYVHMKSSLCRFNPDKPGKSMKPDLIWGLSTLNYEFLVQYIEDQSNQDTHLYPFILYIP